MIIQSFALLVFLLSQLALSNPQHSDPTSKNSNGVIFDGKNKVNPKKTAEINSAISCSFGRESNKKCQKFCDLEKKYGTQFFKNMRIGMTEFYLYPLDLRLQNQVREIQNDRSLLVVPYQMQKNKEGYQEMILDVMEAFSGIEKCQKIFGDLVRKKGHLAMAVALSSATNSRMNVNVDQMIPDWDLGVKTDHLRSYEEIKQFCKKLPGEKSKISTYVEAKLIEMSKREAAEVRKLLPGMTEETIRIEFDGIFSYREPRALANYYDNFRRSVVNDAYISICLKAKDPFGCAEERRSQFSKIVKDSPASLEAKPELKSYAETIRDIEREVKVILTTSESERLPNPFPCMNQLPSNKPNQTVPAGAVQR